MRVVVLVFTILVIKVLKSFDKVTEQLYNKRMKIAFFIVACFGVFSMFMCSHYGCSTRRGEIWFGCLLGAWLALLGICMFGFC